MCDLLRQYGPAQKGISRAECDLAMLVHRFQFHCVYTEFEKLAVQYSAVLFVLQKRSATNKVHKSAPMESTIVLEVALTA